MAAHFAGAASIGERRRRRIAQEFLANSQSASGRRSGRSDRTPSEPESSVEPAVRRRSRWTVVPRNRQWLTVLAILPVLAWGLVLWLGLSGWGEAHGLQELVAFPGGPLASYFSLLALLSASQLSFLIYWYRSKSRKDFMGRYRLWGWAGVFWGVACLVQATGLQFTATGSALAQLQLDSWRPEVMSWLIPLSIGVISLYRLLGREMKAFRPSDVLGEIAFGLGGLSGFLLIGGEQLLPEKIRAVTTAATGLLWQVALGINYLVHAHYVLHVTREVSPLKSSRSTRVARKMVGVVSGIGERTLSFKIRRPLRGEQAEAPSKPKRKRRSEKIAAQQAQPTGAVIDSTVPGEASRAESDSGKRTRSGWFSFGRKKGEDVDAAGGGAGKAKPADKAAEVVKVREAAKPTSAAKPASSPEKFQCKETSQAAADSGKGGRSGWFSFGRKKREDVDAAGGGAGKAKPADKAAEVVKAREAAKPTSAAKPASSPEKFQSKETSQSAADSGKGGRSGWFSFGRKNADAVSEKHRVDEAPKAAEQAAPAPHFEQPKSRPGPLSSGAGRPGESSATSQAQGSAKPVHSRPLRNQDDEDDDYDEEGGRSQQLSSKERKRLKKLQRQQRQS